MAGRGTALLLLAAGVLALLWLVDRGKSQAAIEKAQNQSLGTGIGGGFAT